MSTSANLALTNPALAALARSSPQRAPRRAIRSATPSSTPIPGGGHRAQRPAEQRGHCGVCHFDFDGGGPRNPYGLAVEVAIGSGRLRRRGRSIAIEDDDSDNDGFTQPGRDHRHRELHQHADLPRPARRATSARSLNVDPRRHRGLPHAVGRHRHRRRPRSRCSSPTAARALAAARPRRPSAGPPTDPSGIASVDIYLSDDGGAHLASRWPAACRDTGSFAWFVPNRARRREPDPRRGPRRRRQRRATTTATGLHHRRPRRRHRADDAARHRPAGHPAPRGRRSSTIPSTTCVTCHGNYDHAVEPWHNWHGSMMGQAMRDPLFLATMVVAEQDAPGGRRPLPALPHARRLAGGPLRRHQRRPAHRPRTARRPVRLLPPPGRSRSTCRA